jgi:hypothetical protein
MAHLIGESIAYGFFKELRGNPHETTAGRSTLTGKTLLPPPLFEAASYIT